MAEIQQEFMRLRGICTTADADEMRMPPTNTMFEQYMIRCEPAWVHLGKMLPGQEFQDPEKPSLMMRSAGALKLIRNHEAVIRDVCNPSATDNVIGKPLTQKNLKRVPVDMVMYVEEAMRLTAIKLLGVPKEAVGQAYPVLTGDKQQAQVWAATVLFVMARLQGGDEKPGRTPDMAGDAALAFRTALMEVGREANGM